MNEQKVSEERLRELIQHWHEQANEGVLLAMPDEIRRHRGEMWLALRELLTLRQSASGEIEALEAAQQVEIDRVKNGLGELYCKVMDADESILNPRDNIIADALHLITELATLRHMAARMK